MKLWGGFLAAGVLVVAGSGVATAAASPQTIVLNAIPTSTHQKSIGNGVDEEVVRSFDTAVSDPHKTVGHNVTTCLFSKSDGRPILFTVSTCSVILTLGAGNVITVNLAADQRGVITHGAVAGGTGKFSGTYGTYQSSHFQLGAHPAPPVRITLNIG